MVLMESSKKMSCGDAAPDFSLAGTDNKTYSLDNFRNENVKGILIVFMCNHCPYVKSKLPELNKIADDFKSLGLGVIGINPNDSESYPEDSFENMKKLSKSKEIQFHYLYDETQETAKNYGAACTPDPFLFENTPSGFKLIFHSRIGYPPRPEPSAKNELYDAIKEFLETGKISLIKETPSMGCSIKWKQK